MVIAANRTIRAIPHLDVFLDGHGSAVAGWGLKRSGRRARAMARLAGLPCLLLEDGFLRSTKRSGAPLSLIADEEGVHYDASAPSRLERLIPAPLTPDQATRTRGVIARWRNGRVSKYNHLPEHAGSLPRPFVLVADQTGGDLSITLGGGSSASFARMLAAALAENPGHAVMIKTHPDAIAQGRSGHFGAALLAHPRVYRMAEPCHAVRLLREAEAVYAVTSLMGFEALLWDKPVRCFGMPFYAGWGLTADDLPAPARRQQASLHQLVHAALIAAPRYVDPATGHPWQVEDAITHVAAWRASSGNLAAPGVLVPDNAVHRMLARLRAAWNR